MANSYAVLTVAASRAEVPSPFESLVHIQHLYSEQRSCCCGLSRRGPTLSNMLAITVEAYGKANLAYLSRTAATIGTDEARRAADDLRALFKSVEEDPRRLASCLDQLWSEEEIRSTLRQPTVRVPVSDEGNELPYMLEFLKAHLAVLDDAQAAGLCVLHGQTSP